MMELRVLVDRLWPGKEALQANLWLKEADPSTALCCWFGHERSKWDEFKRRYYLERESKPKVVARLLEEASKTTADVALFSAGCGIQSSGRVEGISHDASQKRDTLAGLQCL